MEEDKQIPSAYRHHWHPFKPEGVLDHTTTLENWRHIQARGFLEPRDPSPHHWSGLRAVFLSDPTDPLYQDRIPRVQAHVLRKGSPLVRLYVAPTAQLFKSSDPERTAQVISLEPIHLDRVVGVEELSVHPLLSYKENHPPAQAEL